MSRTTRLLSILSQNSSSPSWHLRDMVLCCTGTAPITSRTHYVPPGSTSAPRRTWPACAWIRRGPGRSSVKHAATRGSPASHTPRARGGIECLIGAAPADAVGAPASCDVGATTRGAACNIRTGKQCTSGCGRARAVCGDVLQQRIGHQLADRNCRWRARDQAPRTGRPETLAASNRHVRGPRRYTRIRPRSRRTCHRFHPECGPDQRRRVFTRAQRSCPNSTGTRSGLLHDNGIASDQIRVSWE
jgi:hypothetical protein